MARYTWRAVCNLVVPLLVATTNPAHADPPPTDASRNGAATVRTPALAAQPGVAIRAASHDGFGRVVFDLPPGVGADVTDRDGTIVARLRGHPVLGTPRPPRNLLSIMTVDDRVTMAMAPGATWRSLNLPGRLVIDIVDPPTAAQAVPVTQQIIAPPPPAPALPRRASFSGPAPRPPVSRPQVPQDAPAPAAAATPATPPMISAPAMAVPASVPPNAAATTTPSADPPPPPAIAAPDPPSTAIARAATPDVASTPLPAASAAMALAAAVVGPTLSLPFAATTGAAAFRRGGDAVVVFDERRPLDLAALHDDSAFASARVQLLPAGTVLRMAMPPGQVVRLAREESGWTVTKVSEASAGMLAPIRAEVADGQVRFPAAAANRVVSVPDPLTGEALLVGTQLQAGEAAAVARRTPDFTLLATFQGVAVDLVSDSLALHAEPPGFVLHGEAGRSLSLDPLDADAMAVAEAARLTRRWDFPGLPQDALLRRLQAATAAAASAPAQARVQVRLAAVQAQLALGLGAEAHALATLAATDDARAIDSPDAAALDAVAALLAGRFSETDAITDPRLDGTDEVALWRAVRRAQLQPGAPDAAAVFAATMPLLLAYPAALRERLLPLAAETMALGGERTAAKRLLEARKDDTALDLARALLDEAEGHAAPSLAMLDRLAQSPDRRLRARASVRAVEQRLRIGSMTVPAAADALDRLIYAWRGDEQETALRVRVAALRAESGNWRAALAMLRDTSEIEASATTRAALRARMQLVFAEALARDARAALPPLELVSLVEENPDLLPPGDAGQDLAVRLADRLATLDLPHRAEPVLDKLMAATAPGATRAELGARLAVLRLDLNDPGGALLALSASAAAGLPPDLAQRRTIAFARATAAKGALAPALASLAALDTPAADEARASLLEAAKDWRAATAALSTYVARTLPAEGALDATQAATLLRLASAAAQSGDEALLAHLRDHDAVRMPPGKLADMFRLLTERPIQALSDLPRAAQEAALARNFPAALSSLPPQ